MVEVFRTNIQDKVAANKIVNRLCTNFPEAEVNFDLEDCDNILRISSPDATINTDWIIKIVKELGFSIDILP